MIKKPPSALSDDEIRNLLVPFRVTATESHILQIREYAAILLKWNKALSLTTVQTPAEIITRHFGESMFAASEYPVENCRLADLGSGAGFPGLALKIVSPMSKITLIESNSKKCVFLAEVVRTLKLQGVEIIHDRFERLDMTRASFDVVVTRALGLFTDVLAWSKKALADHGSIILWVGSDDMNRLLKKPGWVWQPAVHIPESQRRFLLIGRPDPIPR